MVNVVLYHPQIPQNTGNIIRTCRVTGSTLTLIKPLGFKIESKYLKRAGLDYMDIISLTFLDDLSSYLHTLSTPFYFFSSKATTLYTDVNYSQKSHLIFGSEVAGLPSIFYQTWPDHFLTIPMIFHSRCLNLANSVAIVLYEVWRQNNFTTQRSIID